MITPLLVIFISVLLFPWTLNIECWILNIESPLLFSFSFSSSSSSTTLRLSHLQP